MIVSVLGNLSDMERLDMLERQSQVIELEIVNGKYPGRFLERLQVIA